MLVANNKPQWIPLSQAAQRLGVSPAKLSGMVSSNEIKHKKTLRDKRLVLVDWQELKRLFEVEDEPGNQSSSEQDR